MSSYRLPCVLIVLLGAAACGTSGRHYWLYPTPHLTAEEEALFVTYESHRVISVDDDETAIRCWGDQERMGSQAYRVRSGPCRLHIQPGPHVVVFETSSTMRDRVSLEFVAEAGKSYGLDWSACVGQVIGEGHQRSCVVRVVEIETETGA
jgi:hypothetical protein